MSKAGINVSFATVIPEDKVTLPPPDAKVYPTACDYCVVGCAYRAIVWPVGKEGGPKANQNAYGVDFPITEAQAGNWATPEQHTIETTPTILPSFTLCMFRTPLHRA
jgi:hypothetical protein